uniref:Uncharacterized protein n=1 Tax=Leersia perrieri TaxID=77586 RepID=A0A0D9WTI8_9ORYZ
MAPSQLGIGPVRRLPERFKILRSCSFDSHDGIMPVNALCSNTITRTFLMWSPTQPASGRASPASRLVQPLRFQNIPLMLTKELTVNEKNWSSFRLPIAGETCPPMTLRPTRSAFIAVQE